VLRGGDYSCSGQRRRIKEGERARVCDRPFCGRARPTRSPEARDGDKPKEKASPSLETAERLKAEKPGCAAPGHSIAARIISGGQFDHAGAEPHMGNQNPRALPVLPASGRGCNALLEHGKIISRDGCRETSRILSNARSAASHHSGQTPEFSSVSQRVSRR